MKTRKITITLMILILLSGVTMGAIIDELKAGIIVCFPLESDGSDSMGNVSTLTEESGPVYATGIIGNAVTTNEDDYLHGDLSSILDNSLALTVWAKPSGAVDNGDKIVSFYHDGNNDFHLQDRTGGTEYWNWYDGGLLQTTEYYGTRSIGNWNFYTLIWNGSAVSNHGTRLYVNKTLEWSTGSPQQNGKLDSDYNEFYIGENHDSLGGMDGLIDEIMIWNIALTQVQIDYLVDNLVSCPDLAPAPPAVIPEMNLLFKNKTQTDYKIIFDEGEDFKTHINYTLNNGTLISDGHCNLTFFDGLFENETSVENFTLCGSGCNYSIYTEELWLFTNDSYTQDTIHFSICHAQTPSGNVELNISCGGEYLTETILSGEISLCSNEPTFYLYESHICNNSDYVNVSIINNDPLAKRKIVTDLGVDREFKSLIMGTTYNVTSTLYQSLYYMEYYIHGEKNISGNCSSGFPLNYTSNLTIVNFLPRIYIDGIIINGTNYDNFTTTFDFLYYSPWIFNIPIIDDDIVLINISLLNASGHIIYSLTNTSFFSFIVNSSYFQDFRNNPFNINVSVDDSVGNSYANQTFTVQDDTSPQCYNTGNLSVENLTITTFDIVCRDESFFSFMINCTDGYGFLTTGLFTSKYTFGETNTFWTDTECHIEVWDGHTLEELSPKFIPVKDGITIKTYYKGHENLFTPITGSDFVESSFIQTRDSIKPIFDWNEPDLKTPILKTFHYTTSQDSYYHESDKYKGWIVDFKAKTYFDANLKNDPNAPVFVSRLNSTTWKIDILTNKNKLEFDSIGQLNNNTYDFEVDVYVPFGARFEVGDCPTSITDAMLLGIVMFLGAILILIGMGQSIFGIFGAIIWLVSSFPLMSCSRTIGLAFAGVSLISIIFFAIKQQ